MKKITLGLLTLIFLSIATIAVTPKYDMSKPFTPTRKDWLALEFSDLENAYNTNNREDGYSFSIRPDYDDNDTICTKINLNVFVRNKNLLNDSAYKEQYDTRVNQIKTDIEYLLNYFKWTKGLSVEVVEQ